VSGAEISAETAVLTGTLYPALARLEKAGWATSYWEDADPKLIGRPRRRYYKLTAVGATVARATLNGLARDNTKIQPAGGRVWAWE